MSINMTNLQSYMRRIECSLLLFLIWQSLGLEILSDMAVKTEEFHPVLFAFAPPMGNMRPEGENVKFKENEADQDTAGGALADNAQGTGTVAANTVTVRKDFPDTWIWMHGETDANGQASLTKKLPDSLTSWVISAFAVRDDSELAVTTDALEMSAFNPFFVSLKLPYSIRRTEKFELRVTVFNYEYSELTVDVVLASSDQYKISGLDSRKSIKVQKNNPESVTFLIEATKIGVMNLSVTATGRMGSTSLTDMVIRELVVEPEGVERMQAMTFPVILNQTFTDFSEDVVLDFDGYSMEDVVEGSRRAVVKITGDFMGNALGNLGNLLRMPYGCGEQNMLSTVPNIYALRYLTATNKLKPDFREKAEKFMSAGYMRELTYRRDDNGFSAFGNSDPESSTWLTAFVLRCFAQAKQYIPDTVDVEVLDQSVEFLFKQQENTRDGSFIESGRVIHTEMQGSTSQGETLTVYIVMCMLEARKYGVEIDDAKLEIAVKFIFEEVVNKEGVRRRPYLAAITAYALALLSQDADYALRKGEIQGNVMTLIGYITGGDAPAAPWKKTEKPDTGNSEKRTSYHNKPSINPSNIEITAYCLLAYNTINKVPEGRDLVFWLQKNQNSNGGFGSTQDTVVALQAISEYAVNFNEIVPDCNVEVTALDPQMPSKSVQITADNAVVLQRIELPDETNRVNIRVKGAPKCMAVVKVVWHYYTKPDAMPKDDQLKVVIDTNMVQAGLHKIRACLQRGQDLDYNGMMMFTMRLPSGYSLDDLDNVKQGNEHAVRVDQVEDQVNFYMNEPIDGCLNVMIEQQVLVEDMIPASAKYYAYYKPDIMAENQISLKMDCSDDDCECKGNCSSGATKPGLFSRLLLTAYVCLLLSIVIAM